MFRTEVVEKIETHFMFNKFFSRNRDIYKMEKYYRAGNATDDNVIQRMRFACWITKARNTHLDYAIRTAFARQYLLHQRASMLCHTNCYGVCLVFPTLCKLKICSSSASDEAHT